MAILVVLGVRLVYLKLQETIILILLLFFASPTYSQKIGEFTGLDIPRFVATKSDDINLRVGPSKNYPIKLKYIVKNYPLEVFDEYNNWRKVSDHEGNEGWIHKNLLKGERYAITLSKTNDYLNVFNYPNGKKIGLVKSKNITKLKKCIKDWCLIEINNLIGWTSKENLWGIYENEIYKINYFHPIIVLLWKLRSSYILN